MKKKKNDSIPGRNLWWWRRYPHSLPNEFLRNHFTLLNSHSCRITLRSHLFFFFYAMDHIKDGRFFRVFRRDFLLKNLPPLFFFQTSRLRLYTHLPKARAITRMHLKWEKKEEEGGGEIGWASNFLRAPVSAFSSGYAPGATSSGSHAS